MGFEGQMTLLIPQKDLIVVRTGKTPKEKNQEALGSNFIYPSGSFLIQLAT